MTLLSKNFRYFVEKVGSEFHKEWRETFIQRNPNVRNRFRLTRYGFIYNSSDFIYPMILSVGSCLVHRNLKVARDRSNSSLTYVDILNFEYNQLPNDWKYENEATAQIACQYVIRALRRKWLFNQKFIENVSNRIHQQWIKRNENHSNKELKKPYSQLTEFEKDKDRKSILIACRIYNELLLFKQFNTTPIHFSGPIIQLT